MNVMTPTLRSEARYLAALAAVAVVGVAIAAILQATTEQITAAVVLGGSILTVLDLLMPYIFGALIAWRTGAAIRSGQSRFGALLTLACGAGFVLAVGFVVLLYVVGLSQVSQATFTSPAWPRMIENAVLGPLISFAGAATLALIARRWGVAALGMAVAVIVIVPTVAYFLGLDMRSLWLLGSWYSDSRLGIPYQPGLVSQVLAVLAWWGVLAALVLTFQPKDRA